MENVKEKEQKEEKEKIAKVNKETASIQSLSRKDRDRERNKTKIRKNRVMMRVCVRERGRERSGCKENVVVIEKRTYSRSLKEIR